MVSMHSVSKGFYGECGRRGAFMELVGLPEGVLGELGKLASISLCSNIAGQIATAIIMNPPKVSAAPYIRVQPLSLLCHHCDVQFASVSVMMHT